MIQQLEHCANWDQQVFGEQIWFYSAFQRQEPQDIDAKRHMEKSKMAYPE